MKKSFVMASLVAASTSILFTGCATLFGGGGNQPINIKSDKKVVVDIYKVESIDKNATEENNKKTKEPQLMHKNIEVPSSINIEKSNNDLLLKPTSEGCQEKRVEKKLNNWFWGDVLATSPLSTTIDAATGAIWEYDKDVTLECKK